MAVVHQDGCDPEHDDEKKSEENEGSATLVMVAGTQQVQEAPAHISNFAVALEVSVTGIVNMTACTLSPVFLMLT